MERRNFYILIASIMIGLTVLWLNIYVIIELDIDLFQRADVVVIKGDGIDGEFQISLSEIQDEKYDQVQDQIFTIRNSVGNQYHKIYTGTSLWSILEVENLLKYDSSQLTFQFWSNDGYHSPRPLNLSIALINPHLVIIAYETDDGPLGEEGPLRSVIDDSIMPGGEYSSQYSVQHLNKITIERV